MHTPQIPANEKSRLASLYRTGLLEGVGENRIKALTVLASQMLRRPTAALSLLTSERQLLRAGVNLKLTSTTRAVSFCGHAILNPDQPMVVEDALLDPRFSDNPLVTARRLPFRFYAGVPVCTSDGQPVGALCVLDHVPGSISVADLGTLQKIAKEIELIIHEQAQDNEEYTGLLSELQKALVVGDMTVQWQGIKKVSTMATIGHEALVRWSRDEGSMIRPDDLIPLAVRSGLITRLDRYVLRAGCAAAMQTPGQAAISVNVSGNWLGLKRAALAEVVSQTLTRVGLSPDRLAIEMSEGAIARDPARAQQELQELRAVGVRLALDNCGTGMSSAQYLAGYPFDVIKVDKAIVNEIGKSSRAETIVYSVLRIAHELGKTVCAVGVETTQQLSFLEAEGCDAVQGDLIGRPRPGLGDVATAAG